VHYKSDFHRFNLKQKLAGKRHVAINEFEALIGMLAVKTDKKIVRNEKCQNLFD
jgi:hypothetical protein